MRAIKVVLILGALLCAVPVWATFTLTQHPANPACGTAVSSCTVTLTSALTIDGHHFVVAIAHFQDTTTLIAATPSTSGGTNGAWFHCTCHGTDTTPARGIDGAYMLVPTSSVSSIVISFSASTTGAAVEILEYQFTADTVLLSDQRTRDQTTAVTNPAGVTFTIENATNNVAIQGISTGGTVSAISGSYTNPADFNGFQGDAGWINTTSGTAPTWTTTSARAALNGMLFKEFSVPDIPLSTMELIPTVAQSFTTTGSTIQTQAPAKAGRRFIVAWRSTAVPTGVSLADAMGSSLSSLCTYTTRGSGFIFYSWIGTFAYTGLDTFVISSTGSTSPASSLIEVANLSTTTDTSCATADNNFASFTAAVPAVTTATYRDFLIDFTDCNNTDAFSPAVGESYAPLVNSTTGINPHMQYILTGNPGSYSTTLYDVNNRSCSEIAVAIKSTTSLTVSTRSIPAAVQGSSYHYQLDATGGVGTNSWTVTGGTLPVGLSLSSGGDLNGTCTLSGTNPVTFQVTDSGSNTASVTLSVKCATSASTVSRVQQIQTLSLTSVGVGDCMVFQTTASNNYWFTTPYDELGTVYTTLPGASIGLANAATSRDYTVVQFGCATSSGADTIHPNTAGTSRYLTQYSNLQQVFDTKVLSITYSTSGGATITSNAITSPVAETLYSTAELGTASGSTLSANSPFTDFGSISGGLVDAGDDIGAAAGSNTASYSVTANTSNVWGIILFGLRPTTSGTAPTGARRNSHVF